MLVLNISIYSCLLASFPWYMVKKCCCASYILCSKSFCPSYQYGTSLMNLRNLSTSSPLLTSEKFLFDSTFALVVLEHCPYKRQQVRYLFLSTVTMLITNTFTIFSQILTRVFSASCFYINSSGISMKEMYCNSREIFMSPLY